MYGLDDSIDRLIDAKHELVTQGRNLRAVYNIPFNKKVIYYLNPSGQLDELEVAVIKVLLNAESISNGNDLPKGTPRISSVLGDLYLPLEGLIDFEAEKSRLTKEVNKIEKEIEKVQVKLENTNFTERAPIEVLDEQRARLEEWKTKQVQLTDALISLSA